MYRYILASLLVFLLFGCKVSEKSKKTPTVLFKVGETSVTDQEFEYVYYKNNFNGDSICDAAKIREYLGLFVNFKLKIKAAEEEGLHLSPAFNEEFNGYRDQLAKPYLTDNEVTQKILKEAYERLQTEVHAAHILVTVSAGATAQDTLAAWNNINELREKAVSDEKFEDLARQFSNDPSAKDNGGNLGYFTALQMVYPFENHAYETPVGEISKPFRTQFGYHIVKVYNKRKNRGKVKVSHIMVRATSGISVEDSIAARNKIYEIHNRLKQGANWFELASAFSDDINSKAKGGQLPWISTGNVTPEFEDVAFSLKVGQISEPVKTIYGWHIIKLDETQPLESYEALEPMLKNRIENDPRSELSKHALIKRLKNENQIVENLKVVNQIVEEADSSLLSGHWKYDTGDPLLEKKLFSIKDKEYKVNDFYPYVLEQQGRTLNASSSPSSASQAIQLLYSNFLNEEMIKFEKDHLQEKYTDYKMLLNEYREGIMLFQMMEDKVWTKASEDTTGLRDFFFANHENYKWSDRVDAVIFRSEEKEVIQNLKLKLESWEFDLDSLVKEINKNNPLSLHVEDGVFEIENHPVLKDVTLSEGKFNIELQNNFYLVLVNKVIPASYKALDEVRGQAISDYQTYLEEQWIKQLREKYPVQVNETEVKKVINKCEKKE